jgi:hypothetical protein
MRSHFGTYLCVDKNILAEDFYLKKHGRQYPLMKQVKTKRKLTKTGKKYQTNGN